MRTSKTSKVMTRGKASVGIVMGSDSDWPTVQEAARTLDSFGVSYDVRVISAHRTPDLARAYARSAARRGIKVIIAAAGGAAHLAGVLAGHATLPVIGIPMETSTLRGLDSLLSTVQMPAGVPVATMSVGKAGSVNAAVLAVQVLALSAPGLAGRLNAHKHALRRKVVRANARLRG